MTYLNIDLLEYIIQFNIVYKNKYKIVTFNPFRLRSFEITNNLCYDWKHFYYIDLNEKRFTYLSHKPQVFYTREYCECDDYECDDYKKNFSVVKNLKLDLSVIQKRFLYGSRNLELKYSELMKNDSFFS